VTLKTFILLLISICFSSVAQIVLKTGLSQPHVAVAMDGSSYVGIVRAVFLNTWVIVGLTLYFSAAVVWLFALVRIEVSMAYPFVGLGFILTMILGKFIMGDDVTLTRLAGTMMISVGVVFVSWR
jgi:multidrug transporter EmrE-like cation transporter